MPHWLPVHPTLEQEHDPLVGLQEAVPSVLHMLPDM